MTTNKSRSTPISFDLRWYQRDAKRAIYDSLATAPEINPCVVLPTGSGKTPLLASVCQDVAGQWGGRVLILAHVKELLQQSAHTLQSFLPADMVGVYSAGLGSRDTQHPVIVAGIQSVYKKAGTLGSFAAIIVDEAHLIPAHDGGMYRTFLAAAKVVNPRVKIIGLTATPYRLDCGYICDPNNILNDIVYEAGIKELIVQGFLCPLKTRAGKEHPDLAGIHTRGGEYIESEMAERMDVIVKPACQEIVSLTRDRKSVLIFASNVAHGRHVQSILESILLPCEIGFICGKTPAKERAELLSRFKTGALKYLVNVNVLTTGFDAPNIDTIVLLRATLSPGLYYQMVGRGLRVDESKIECLVLDYGENTVRHGPIDAIHINEKISNGDGDAPAKECPECQYVCFAGVARCPECGFEFPKPELKHGTHAGKAGILSGEITTTKYHIDSVAYFVHAKRGAGESAPKTMRVEYYTSSIFGDVKKEYVCFDHDGWARQRAEQWWRDRSILPVPDSTTEAVGLADAGALVNTTAITWREVSGEKYGSIIGYEIDDKKPELETVSSNLFVELDEDEMPF